jgi:hypothetical protein
VTTRVYPARNFTRYGVPGISRYRMPRRRAAGKPGAFFKRSGKTRRPGENLYDRGRSRGYTERSEPLPVGAACFNQMLHRKRCAGR